MTIAETLATRIAGVSYDVLPDEARHWAKVAIMDTVGCILAGADEPCARIAAQVASIGGANGPCVVFGTSRRVGPMDAASINGTAAHALDYDDCSDTLGGHPSAPILPALFALAETRGANGQDFIAAYVAGWETETRIARGVNFHHYEKGWHPTATLGVFGATAACARLLGLTVEKTAQALALAATFSSGLKANFGTMTKPLHVGQAARNGLYAALLASEGFTSSTDALEHRQGFLRVFNGEGNFTIDPIVAEWGSPWDIVDPGLTIKQYPCCGSTHPAVDAMLMLVRENDLTPAMVDRIESQTHPRRLAHTNRPDPRGALDAKFSVQYCLARALVSRQVLIEHFEDGSYDEPEVRAVLPASFFDGMAGAEDGSVGALRRRCAGHADRWSRVDQIGAAAVRARTVHSIAAGVAARQIHRLRATSSAGRGGAALARTSGYARNRQPNSRIDRGDGPPDGAGGGLTGPTLARGPPGTARQVRRWPVGCFG